MLYIKSEINTTDSEEVQILIDGLIIRMLRPYYLFNHDTPKVNKLLQSIDFSKHNFIHYLFYKLPKPIIKILYLLIKNNQMNILLINDFKTGGGAEVIFIKPIKPSWP